MRRFIKDVDFTKKFSKITKTFSKVLKEAKDLDVQISEALEEKEEKIIEIKKEIETMDVLKLKNNTFIEKMADLIDS